MTPRDRDLPAEPAVGPHHGEPGLGTDDPVSAEDRSQMGDTLDEWLHLSPPDVAAEFG